MPNHYLNPWWNIVNLTIGNKLQWNLNRNLHIFIQENAFENVRKFAAILAWPQSVKRSCRLDFMIRYRGSNTSKGHKTCLITKYRPALCWINLMADFYTTLQWHHNGHDGISNCQHLHCLLSSLFRHRSKKTSKLCVTGLCEGNPQVTCEFPAQKASNAENVSIWWCHHNAPILAITSHRNA